MFNSEFLIDYFNQLPLLIQMVWGISGLMFFAIFGLIIYLKFYRSYYVRKKDNRSKLREKFELLIVTYLYSSNGDDNLSDDQKPILDTLKKSAANHHERRIIVSTLLKLNNEISGEMAKAIQKLYFQIGLLPYALIGLTSNKWHIVGKSVRELTQFQIKEEYDTVIKLVNHPHPQVRKEVQLYIVNLFHFKGLAYLNDLKTPLSEWDQIQLLEILQREESQQSLDISPWLTSKNESVILFALKLAKIYNLFEAKDPISKLLLHPTEKVRICAIEALNQLYATDVKERLKTGFTSKGVKEQLAVLKLLENIYDNQDESFLLEQIHHENFDIRLKALHILKLINVENLEILKVESKDPKYIETLNFVANN